MSQFEKDSDPTADPADNEEGLTLDEGDDVLEEEEDELLADVDEDDEDEIDFDNDEDEDDQ